MGSSDPQLPKAAMLIKQIRAMDFDFESKSDAPNYLGGLADRTQLRNSIRKLAKELPGTTRAVCENFIPPEHLESYERFYTGEYRDISNMPRGRLSPQALNAIDHATTIVRGVTQTDKSIVITRYTKHRDDYDLVSFWQREPPEIAANRLAFHNRFIAFDATGPTSAVLDGKPYKLEVYRAVTLDEPSLRQFTNGIGF